MDRKWLYPFHWLKNRKCDFHWIFPSNSSEGGLVFIFKCGSRKEKYLNNYLYFKGLLYIWEEMIMMALLYMAGLENSECIWKIQRKPEVAGTCFIQKIYAPSSSLLQGKHLPFTPSPLRLNIFRLFVILSLTQLYRYTPEIFLFSTNWCQIGKER
jgi:hypothetical protein